MVNNEFLKFDIRQKNELIASWKELFDVVNWFCNETKKGQTFLEEIWYLTKPEFSLFFLKNKVEEIINSYQFDFDYVYNKNLVSSLLSIYKNYAIYLNNLKQQNILDEKLVTNNLEINLVSQNVLNLCKLDNIIDTIATISHYSFVLGFQHDENSNLKLGIYKVNYDDQILKLVDSEMNKKDDFVDALVKVQEAIKCQDVKNSIAALMYLYRIVENEFNLYFSIIDKEYSTLVRRFIHSVIRHDGILYESQGMKLRLGFQNATLEKQIKLLDDVKNYLVTIKLLSTRKNQDSIYKTFSHLIDSHDLTLPGFIPIEINKILEKTETTIIVDVHRDGEIKIDESEYDQTLSSISINNELFKQHTINFNEVKSNILETTHLFENDNHELKKDSINDEGAINNLSSSQIIEIELNKKEDTNLESVTTINSIEIDINNVNNKKNDNFLNVEQIQESIDKSSEIPQQISIDIDVEINSKKKDKSKKEKGEITIQKTICSPLWQNLSTKQLLIDVGAKKKNKYDFDINENYVNISKNVEKQISTLDKNTLMNNLILFQQNFASPYLDEINFEKPKKEKLKKVSMKELRKEAHAKIQTLNEKMPKSIINKK